ncbi:hypothetical protein GQ53DRAFT_746476 [Thozetella sp. PMI_491]|nr:hypothetical protein GQ53DRAFT_746476 [Thozetella sp. PMI_491]
MSFTNAPVSRVLVLGLVMGSIAASLFDIKHYFYIVVDLHILRYHQTWRALIYQLCYTNSSEVLFGAMTLYHLRVIERMWGSRKYASFILVAGILTSVLPPILLAALLRPLTLGMFNYLPAGPTPLIFAVLAQYHAIIPHMYKYRLAFSATPPTTDEFMGLTFSDKSYRYLLALQLALFQWPGSLLGAAVGWLVGYSWRSDLLPGALTRWRVPGWVVGIRTQKRNDGFEGLLRRLEDENTSGAASGIQPPVDGETSRRRQMSQQIMDQVREAF